MIHSLLERVQQSVCKRGVFGTVALGIRRYIIFPIDRFVTLILSRFYVNGFVKFYYYSFVWYNKVHWLGGRLIKLPLDCWVYQEIIWETRPDFIIETGTFEGGSSLFLASICDLIGQGRVLTIDVQQCELIHPRVTKIIGSSVAEDVLEEIRQVIGERTAMVILDSNHSKDHVLKELTLYADLVSPGSYLIVEDTLINKHPWFEPDVDGGPMAAINEFLRNRSDFVIDPTREKFSATWNRKGYLKRVAMSGDALLLTK